MIKREGSLVLARSIYPTKSSSIYSNFLIGQPTFVTKRRKEVIDITLASPYISAQVSKWHVSEEPSNSDHRYILLEVKNFDKTMDMYHNPRKTDWALYREELKTKLNMIKSKISSTLDIEETSEKLEEAIITSYHISCPQVKRTRKREVSWWNKELEQLRPETRKLYNRAKKTGEWAEYSKTLTDYNKMMRKAKRDSWRKLCEDVESTSEGARLQRLLAKDPINPVGTITKPNGEHTVNGKETMETLLQTHFPGSTVTQPYMDEQP